MNYKHTETDTECYNGFYERFVLNFDETYSWYIAFTREYPWDEETSTANKDFVLHT